MMRRTDFTITDQGTIWMFVPLTQKALTWLTEEVYSEDWQWFGAVRTVGGMLCVDHRYAADIAEHIIEEGFRVAV